ncbi:glycosyltransferase [Cavenderia fasciculata]|uniref:Mannosyltransferase n=1 Tax=Cavenderia fasciculata TaxID=261658 RepID=F4QE99_CACFS|nr:glycosyltransferase [Cavenderia fasciculata]EGG14046.1 glycosyltransferase [Cavenderia fasciculata]|eukprot:XP_004350754.1 glycosyltransferase [Cavenderia fasciculata]
MVKAKSSSSSSSSSRQKGKDVQPISSSSSSSSDDDQSFSPSSKTVFLFLGLSAALSALFNRINDCDEFMNYWEPTHYLMFGKGLQTWEYSPVYALRSYAYLLYHSSFGQLLYMIAQENKVTTFFLMKIFLGLQCAFSQTIFYAGVKKLFGNQISFLMAIFMFFSPGFFLSSTVYLPNTFSMTMIMFSYGFWMLNRPFLAVFTCACSVFMGWPFVIVVGAPMALSLIVEYGFINVLVWAIVPTVSVFAPMIMIDEKYYGKLVIAILNIILYNFTSDHEGGSQLYGIEDWKFYFINCFVNFNVIFFIALLSIPLIIILYSNRGVLSNRPLFKLILAMSPFVMWFSFMTYLPHKEERFLFVIYPFICLSASVTLYLVANFISDLYKYQSRLSTKSTDDESKKKSTAAGQSSLLLTILGLLNFLVDLSIKAVVLLFIALSVSRIYATFRNYDASIEAYGFLYDDVLRAGDVTDIQFPKTIRIGSNVNVCVGKEWYRFPSQFFLPNDRVDDRSTKTNKPMITFNLAFLESEFKGHLPKPFSQQPNGTMVIPTNMNDQNQQEMDRYIDDINKCSFIVDFDNNPDNSYLNKLSKDQFRIIYSRPFLDASKSNSLARAFYIPYFSDKRITFAPYIILENRNN